MLAAVAVSTRVLSQGSVELGRLGDSVFVKEIDQGCYHYDEFVSEWNAEGGDFVDGERRIARSVVEELRQVVWETRNAEDLLSQYEQEITAERFEKQLREELPWVPRSPSTAELQSEARAALDGSPPNSTSKIFTHVIIDGEPKVELLLQRSYIEHHERLALSCGLPEWQVRYGAKSWETRSPRLAKALKPFTKKSDAFDDIVRWPDAYAEALAHTITRDYAQRYVLSYLEDTLTSDFEVDGLDSRRSDPFSDSCTFMLKPQHSEKIAHLVLNLPLLEDPRPLLDAIPACLADAEQRLADIPWLRQATQDKKVILSPFNSGKDYYLQFDGFSGITVRVLVRDSEEELLVSSPTRDVVSLVKLAPSQQRTTHLLVSSDGSARFVTALGEPVE